MFALKQKTKQKNKKKPGKITGRIIIFCNIAVYALENQIHMEIKIMKNQN